jgi:hypothetical protein
LTLLLVVVVRLLTDLIDRAGRVNTAEANSVH